ncbi:MAG: hypothetical protein JSU74_11810 [Candidatus Zixiibacteriota bacterium]|nr:MAG: hypothetical protein JSU74_11810 [candidate division Zixibacteria bacterium]
MNKYIKTILFILPALLVYAYFCRQLDFTQDDAYISYRYVANFLDGHGLVYNVGERIEGFTNFGWIVYLIFWGALGAPFIVISKVTGFILGGGIIVLTFLLGRRVGHSHGYLIALPAVYLVALNQSLAYWSPAGLETAAFAFAAMLSLYFYLKRSWLLTLSLTAAVLLRPEGALIAFIVLVIETIERRRLPVYSLCCASLALLISLPYVGFKLYYYGSILPNPFYAKTGLEAGRLLDGLEYSGRFFSHYGFYGLGLLVPLFMQRRLPRDFRPVWLFTVIYMVYVVLIGGDVLKVHRFFLPVIGISAIVLSTAVWLVADRLPKRASRPVILIASVALLFGTYMLPRRFVHQYYNLEKGLTSKMDFISKQMLATDTSGFSAAVPTIGIFGYNLLGHRVIDMLGLTDSTIAKHSEQPVAGTSSTWKERRHNSAYLLGLKPDYILFSTDIKPSAPAEMALHLYRQFLDSYRTIGWVNPSLPNSPTFSVFKRVKDIEGRLVPEYPLEFVENYKQGMEYYMAGDYGRAVQSYQRAREVSPLPPYVYLEYNLGFCYILLNRQQEGIALLDSVAARDSMVFLANAVLYKHAVLTNQREKADRHRRWFRAFVPWLVPVLERETAALVGGRKP